MSATLHTTGTATEVQLAGVPATERTGIGRALHRFGMTAVDRHDPAPDNPSSAFLVVHTESNSASFAQLIEETVTAMSRLVRRHLAVSDLQLGGAIVLCCPTGTGEGHELEAVVGRAAARQAVVGLGRVLANEVGDMGVRVNVVDPAVRPWPPATAESIAFLLSSQARRITGLHLTVAHTGTAPPR